MAPRTGRSPYLISALVIVTLSAAGCGDAGVPSQLTGDGVNGGTDDGGNSGGNESGDDGDSGTPRSALDLREVYVAFTITDHSELAELTRLVSIDRVDGNLVHAYATAAQLSELTQRGYDVVELPHPGENPGADMSMRTQRGAPTNWAAFPRYSDYVAMMRGWATKYPSICRLVDLGATTNTKRPHKLWALKISDRPDVAEDEPEVLYTSTMHGDETVGYVLLLHFIDDLLANYGVDPTATALVDNLEIWVNPLANPDGTYFKSDDSVSGAIRSYTSATGGYSGIDPNRNFPELDGTNPDAPWAETRAMIAFAEAHHVVLSASFHGGAEVANYPWDGTTRRHPDDAWLKAASRDYATHAQHDGPSGYFTELDNGITNGADWYEVYGGRQDYMTYFRGAREITFEVSSTKNPSGQQLPSFWQANRAALYSYLELALHGVRGVVTSAAGAPLAATVTVVGHDTEIDRSRVTTDPAVGDYHRVLVPGTYTLAFAAPGYVTKTVANVVVASSNATRLDVTLAPDGGPDPDPDPDPNPDPDPDPNPDPDPDPQPSLFIADFEADGAGLVASGSGGAGFGWGAPSVVGAHSGTHAWAAPLSGSYANDADWVLETPVIRIDERGAVLRFWHWYDFEESYSAYDGGQVQVVVEGSSAAPAVLTPNGGYPAENVVALEGPGFSGASQGWVESTFDLSAHAGQSVRLRWRLASDRSVVRRGWAIDDISVGPATAFNAP